jgi:hypothetical protein
MREGTGRGPTALTRSTEEALNSYSVHLNFLAITGNFSNFKIYAVRGPTLIKVVRAPNWRAYRLPRVLGDSDWPEYWVTLGPTAGFEPLVVEPGSNPALTRHGLFHSLLGRAESSLRREQVEQRQVLIECGTAQQFLERAVLAELLMDKVPGDVAPPF